MEVAKEHPDFAEEAAYLEKVCEAIDREVENLRNLGWSGGANASATFWVQDRAWKQSDALLERRDEPYFGRIDVIGADSPETLYIGTIGIRDSAMRARLVIDWRTPAARPFYKPSRQTLLKRRLIIKQATLTSIFDDQVRQPSAIDIPGVSGATLIDPSLQLLLSRSRGQQLDNIVATIQDHQDELVRSDEKIMIIQGGAGTGKTVVALHRLAYLLYLHRFRNSENETGTETNTRARHRQNRHPSEQELRVAIFGPNRVFLKFVADVLPSLNEKEVIQSTFSDWFSEWCGKDSPVLNDDDTSLDVIVSSKSPISTRATTYRRARLKGSMRMGGILDQYATYYLNQVIDRLTDSDLVFDAVLESKNTRFQLPTAPLRFLSREYSGRPLNTIRSVAFQRLAVGIGDEVAKFMQMRRLGLDPSQFEGNVRHVQRIFRNNFDAFWPQVRFADLYKSLLSDSTFRNRMTGKPFHADLTRMLTPRAFSSEDIPALAYLRLLCDGPTLGFDHVVIDEAQDVAPLQLRVLLKHCSDFTLIGDIGQGINSHSGVRSWKETMLAFSGMEPRFRILSQGYRSTWEITEFANMILQRGSDELVAAGVDLDAIRVRPFPRYGEAPILSGLRTMPELSAAITRFVVESIAAGYQSIAIICRTSGLAELLFREVGPMLPWPSESVLGLADTITAPITFISIHLAKGLEFDAVAVVNVSAEDFPKTDHDVRLLYTAATRALHRLMIAWIGQPSLLIPQNRPTRRTSSK